MYMELPPHRLWLGSHLGRLTGIIERTTEAGAPRGLALSTSFSTTEEAFVYQQHLLTLVLKYFNWEIMPRPSMHHYCLS